MTPRQRDVVDLIVGILDDDQLETLVFLLDKTNDPYALFANRIEKLKPELAVKLYDGPQLGEDERAPHS